MQINGIEELNNLYIYICSHINNIIINVYRHEYQSHTIVTYHGSSCNALIDA